MVKWKDILTDLWRGPDPILIRSRGAILCFFHRMKKILCGSQKDSTRRASSDLQKSELHPLPGS
ncbi:hypothetical protein ACQP3F_25555 [Escherichia coli]